MSVLTKIIDSTFIITLDRQEKHNAFDETVIFELTQQIESASNNPEIKVVILNANGKHFSAGADLNWMKKMAEFSLEENEKDAMELANLLKALYFCPKITIAVIQGGAIGGGAGLVAACDYALASPDAFFAFTEVKLGLVPAVISPYVIEKLGTNQAKKLFLCARRFKADEALKLGFIDEIIDNDTKNEKALAFAKSFNELAPETIRFCKKLVNDVATYPINEKLIEMTAKTIAHVRQSQSAKQRINAFLNKDKA